MHPLRHGDRAGHDDDLPQPPEAERVSPPTIVHATAPIPSGRAACGANEAAPTLPILLLIVIVGKGGKLDKVGQGALVSRALHPVRPKNDFDRVRADRTRLRHHIWVTFPAATEHTVVLTPLLWYDRRRTPIMGRVLLAGWVETQRGFPMRLPRMTMRRWMIAVAVAGDLLGAVVWGRRLKQRRDFTSSRPTSTRGWSDFSDPSRRCFRPASRRLAGPSKTSQGSWSARASHQPWLWLVSTRIWPAGSLDITRS